MPSADRVVVTRGHGYELRVESGELDVDGVRERLEAGRIALAAGEAERAAMLLREALEVWRGTALADFVYEPFAQVEIERLEELRIAVLSERIDADLALGRHLDLVGELEALVQQHPLHERLREQLMVALYRSGLQAEALELYQDTRRALVGELGLEPGPELQRLERAILTHDPALDLTATHRLRRGNIRTPRPRWRGQLLAVAIAAVILGVALAVLLEHSAGLVAKPPNSVGVIDPKTNALVARLAVGGGASGIAANSRSVWVMNAFDLTVSYINARTEHVLATTAVWANGGGLTAITYGDGAAWVTNGYLGSVRRIDPLVGLGPPFRIEPFSADDIALAAGDGGLWAASTHNSAVIRIDPNRGRVVATIRSLQVPIGIAVGPTAVWYIAIARSRERGSLVRIDPTTDRKVAVVPLPAAPTALAVGAGAVWVAVNGRDAVWRIDPVTNSVERTIAVGAGPNAVAVASGSLWVANAKSDTISRVDPASNKVIATIDLHATPGAIAGSAGKIWVVGI